MEKKATISSVWLLQHPHFVRKKQQSAFTVFSLDVTQEQTGSPNHASKGKTQVPTTKLNNFSPRGPPTLPMTRHIASINVLEICRPAIFQIFSIFSRKYYREEPGTGKVGQMLQKFPGIPVKARKREYLERYYVLSKTFHRDDPFYLNSSRKYFKNSYISF